MTAFIIVNILTIALLARAIIDYFKLKKHLSIDQKKDLKKDPLASIQIVDVLFNQSLRDNPDARKIQKRVIWLFCLSLLLVHVSSEIYKTQIK